MLTAFHQLLTYSDDLADPIYVLSTTSVAHTFCRHHPDCGKEQAIGDIVHYLEDCIVKRLRTNLKIRANREKANRNILK